MNQKIFEKYRDFMESTEKNAYVAMVEEETILREAGGRKALNVLSNVRTLANKDEELMQFKLHIEEKKKDVIKKKDDKEKDAEEDGEEEEVVEEEVIDSMDDEEFRKRVMEDLEEGFKLFDINGDGKISLHELISVMNSVGANVSMEDAQEILELVDEDGDGEINFEEFKNVMHEKMMQGTVEEDLLATFEVIDADHDGFISAKEIQSLFYKLGELITLDEAADIMKTCDLNEDGLIDFDEFKLFYEKITTQYSKVSQPVVATTTTTVIEKKVETIKEEESQAFTLG